MKQQIGMRVQVLSKSSPNLNVTSKYYFKTNMCCQARLSSLSFPLRPHEGAEGMINE